jgi:hypothetical protein
MSNQNEFADRKFLLDHSASWRDVRTALYLTLALVVVAAVLVFFPGTSFDPPPAEDPSAKSQGRLIGTRDPGRVGWRGQNGAWNTLGTHEAVGSLDDVPASEEKTEPGR